jgi:tRNA pseudouridine38-40 synthase
MSDDTLETRNSKLTTKIVLVLEYDGTNYCGFQFQENAPTIQDEIEKAIFKLTGEKLRVVAASRTDTGVHARGQVLCFRTGSKIQPGNFTGGLNYYLPQDIAVKAAYKVNDRFNVQLNAVSRRYDYFILNCRTRSPLQRAFSYQVGGELDIAAMNEAARVLVGEHDLVSFVTEISRSSVKSTLRRVYSAGLERCGEMVVFTITARSFLPHQVRNTVGSLIRVGLGKINVDDFKKIMEARKPGLAGPTVPAMGLYLTEVNYPRPLGDYNEDL